MALLKVFTAIDPVLRKKSDPIDQVDDSIRLLMDDMLETINHVEALGLAANQIGVLKRVLVIDPRANNASTQKNAKIKTPIFAANPEIIEYSQEESFCEEGCLSVPGKYISISRPESIKVKYLDYDNNLQNIECDGMLARVFQHEIDHLDGKLMLDYLSKIKRDLAIVALRKKAKAQATQ